MLEEDLVLIFSANENFVDLVLTYNLEICYDESNDTEEDDYERYNESCIIAFQEAAERDSQEIEEEGDGISSPSCTAYRMEI